MNKNKKRLFYEPSRFCRLRWNAEQTSKCISLFAIEKCSVINTDWCNFKSGIRVIRVAHRSTLPPCSQPTKVRWYNSQVPNTEYRFGQQIDFSASNRRQRSAACLIWQLFEILWLILLKPDEVRSLLFPFFFFFVDSLYISETARSIFLIKHSN